MNSNTPFPSAAENELSRIRTLLSSIESVLRKHSDFNTNLDTDESTCECGEIFSHSEVLDPAVDDEFIEHVADKLKAYLLGEEE